MLLLFSSYAPIAPPPTTLPLLDPRATVRRVMPAAVPRALALPRATATAQLPAAVLAALMPAARVRSLAPPRATVRVVKGS